MADYIFPFAASFFLSIFFIMACIGIGKKIKWKGRDAVRHIRKNSVLRVGGIAVALSFALMVVLYSGVSRTPELVGFFLAAAVVVLFGIADDIREMSWKKQLFFQMSAAAVVFFCGVKIYYVSNPFTGEIFLFNSGFGALVSFLLVVIWITLIMNSINWLDGIDGLAGGVSFISALTIFFLSLKAEVNQPSMAVLAIILAGAILGFLVFNFNPARVLAGTAGSMFMGFALAVLAIFAGTKIATSLLVMALPFFDFVWVLAERIKNKKSIFEPDQNHLHHKLLKLGWSQRKTAVCLYAVTALISFIALNTRALGKGMVFLAVFLVMYLFMKIIDQKLHIKK